MRSALRAALVLVLVGSAGCSPAPPSGSAGDWPGYDTLPALCEAATHVVVVGTRSSRVRDVVVEPLPGGGGSPEEDPRLGAPGAEPPAALVLATRVSVVEVEEVLAGDGLEPGDVLEVGEPTEAPESAERSLVAGAGRRVLFLDLVPGRLAGLVNPTQGGYAVEDGRLVEAFEGHRPGPAAGARADRGLCPQAADG